MSNYQLEIKQVLDYPRCRIYRQFIQSLMEDRSIRTGGSSGLFYYAILCSYANFRTSYRRIDGNGYTVYPGEWICKVRDIVRWFRVRSGRQVIEALDALQSKGVLTYVLLENEKVIKFKINDWKYHNTILDYNCPCQKDSGFYFMPLTVAKELVKSGKCSEMDILLDLWLSAIYNDKLVQGSEIAPVVYLRNGTGVPVVSYSELAVRWGISKATVSRVLMKLELTNYIALVNFTGRTGSAIYLKNYLSTMFQISDVLVDKEEIAITLNVNIAEENTEEELHEVIVSEELICVSKSHIDAVVPKVAKILKTQGIHCAKCQNSTYKLYPLSCDCREGNLGFVLTLLCGQNETPYTFEIFMKPQIHEV